MAAKKKKKGECSLFPFKREEIVSIQEIRQHLGWGISTFDLPDAWKITKGEGVKVAVLDTGCDLDHPDLKANLLPGVNFINPRRKPWDDNQHGCVHPSSIIQTNFCGTETIEELYNRLPVQEQNQKFSDGYTSKLRDVSSLGIKTISFDLKTEKTVVDTVTHVHKMPVKTNLICIEMEGGLELKLTPWHPVIVSRMTKGRRSKIFKKRADELDKEDRLILSNSSVSLSSEPYRITYEVWRCKNCGHIPKCKIPKSNCKKCRQKQWVMSTEFANEKLAYICGLVLTDGHIIHDRNYRVDITNKNEAILEQAKRFLKELGFNCRIDCPKNRCPRLLINSKRLVLLLQAVGIKSKGKTYFQTLPEFIGKSPLAIIQAFLGGVIDGDGCISRTNTGNRVTTVSKDFAEHLSAILNGIGISAGIVRYKNKFRGKNNLKFPIFNVVFSKLPAEIAKWIASPHKKQRILANQTSQRRSIRRIKNIHQEVFEGNFYDFTTQKTNTYIANGHFVSNTHVTGIICALDNKIGTVGVAPKSKVLPVKVLNEKGDGNLENVARGIRWAVTQGADMMCLSLGAPRPIQQVRKAIQFAAKRGIPCFVAAGNAGRTDEVFYPAAYPETISIGSIDEDLDRSDFSNTGKQLDFMAPGGRIFSTVPDNWYAFLSGTSMAAPFACGVAALLLAYSRKTDQLTLKTVDDYRKVLRTHTTPIRNRKLAGRKFFEGYGIIDPRKLMDAIEG